MRGFLGVLFSLFLTAFASVALANQDVCFGAWYPNDGEAVTYKFSIVCKNSASAPIATFTAKQTLYAIFSLSKKKQASMEQDAISQAAAQGFVYVGSHIGDYTILFRGAKIDVADVCVLKGSQDAVCGGNTHITGNGIDSTYRNLLNNGFIPVAVFSYKTVFIRQK